MTELLVQPEEGGLEGRRYTCERERGPPVPLYRNRHRIHNLLNDVLGADGFLHARRIHPVNANPVGENWHRQRLEVLWNAETSSI